MSESQPSEGFGGAGGRQRHVFICGLHRSGTTLIARSLARHPAVAGFQNTGVIEDEGQFLQTVLPLETEFGGVGRFGFDPRAHMTETAAFNTPEQAARLRAEWHRHWDVSKPVLLEKTPSNLLRMRLLQEMLPPSYFVIVTRHPIATALASTKWTESNIFSLLVHWVHCYQLARNDAAQVDRAIWLSYEAFVTEPQKQLARLADFLGLPPSEGWTVPPLQNQNVDYFDLWRTQYYGDSQRAIEQNPPEQPRGLVRRVSDRIARDRRERALPPHRRRANLHNFYDALDAVALLEPALAQFGYSFLDLDRTPAFGVDSHHPLP
jgi:hypothetical protein